MTNDETLKLFLGMITAGTITGIVVSLLFVFPKWRSKN